MKRLSFSWDTLLIAAIMLVATVCAQSQAQEAEEGRVVKIDLADEAAAADDLDVPRERIIEEPAYWIGVSGRNVASPVLRTHLQIAEGIGVVIEQVIPDSPAEKAGLRQHDIILRANGDAVDDMQVLQNHVRTSKDKPLELKIIRLGKQEKIVVIAEPRPDRLNEQAGNFRQLNAGDRVNPGDVLGQLMQQFGGRNFGPGVVLRGGGGQAFNLNQIPNGVSVSMQRNNDEPARITVKKGDKTWEINGEDEESLKQLPGDVRPFVERILNGQNNFQGFGAGFNLGDFNGELDDLLPGVLGDMRPQVIQPRRRQREPRQDEMKQRMEKLERRLQQLQEKFNNQGPALPQGGQTS